jgi:hypothetical protein
MAYLFNQPPQQQSSTPSNPGVNGEQPQNVQTSPKSTFKDPSALTNKNKTVNQGAVNTAVVGGAQKNIESNTAELQNKAAEYTKTQKSNFAQSVNAKQDLASGGNKLQSILKGPQFKADTFNFKQTNTPSQKPISSSRQGSFYSQGMQNTDQEVYRASGQEAAEQAEVNRLNQLFQNNVQNTGNQLQNDLTNQGLNQQALVQSDIKNQLQGVQQGLKQSDQAAFQNKMKQRQDLEVQDALARARAQGSNVTEAQIRSQLAQYNPTENYVSDANFNERQRINELLGNEEQLSSTIGTLGNDDKINKLIESNIPQKQAALYDPKKQPGYYGNITAVPRNIMGRAGTDLGGLFSIRSPKPTRIKERK